MRRFIRILILAVALVPLAAPGWSQKRVALVVGNGACRAVPHQPNPGADAAAVAEALPAAGFTADPQREVGRASPQGQAGLPRLE